jgi:hypothetical protein
MREYTIASTPGGVTLAAHAPLALLQIMPAAAPAANIAIYRVWCGQAANATSAQQQIEHCTQVAAFATTAVSVTPVALKMVDPASGIAGATTIAAGKCGFNIGTEGAGTKTTKFNDSFNVLNGYLWVPTQAEIQVYPASSLSAYTVQVPTQPGSLTLWTFGLNFAEV